MRGKWRQESSIQATTSKGSGVRRSWIHALVIAGGFSACTALVFAFYQLPLNSSEIVIVVAFWFLVVKVAQFLRRRVSRSNPPKSAFLLIFTLLCWHRSRAGASSAPQQEDMQPATTDMIACSASEFLAQRGDRVELYAYSAKSLSPSAFVWSVPAGVLRPSTGTTATWTLSGLPAEATTTTAIVSVQDRSMLPVRCDVDIAIRPDRIVSRGSAAVTGRALVSQVEPEEQGFPLYSYLLFGRRPLGGERQLCLTSIEAVLSYAEDLTELRRYFQVDQLNLAVLFVTQKPTVQVNQLSPEKLAEWTLDHYNYARAEKVLARTGDTKRDLIYLVTSDAPIGAFHDTNPNREAVVQNLNGVPEAIIAGVIRRFLNQAVRADRSKSDQIYSLVLRARILIALAGTTTPELTKAADSIVTLFRK
jgi:hypothetical protein